MADQLKYWTVDEAQQALPRALELLDALRPVLMQLGEQQRTRGSAGAQASGGNGAPHNGHGGLAAAADLEVRAQRILSQVSEAGFQIKDVEAGLIAFPYLRRGETVLLCYRRGEPEINFWHDLQSGFAGRRPLAEL